MGELLSEEWLHRVVGVLVRFVEVGAALIIFAGAVVGFVRFARVFLWRQHSQHYERVRLTMGRFLALGLEFQLASDLLRTAVAPTWQQIGQLAAVAAIRTALNYFLSKEIHAEQRATQALQHEPGAPPAAPTGRPAPASRQDAPPPAAH